MGRPIMAAVLSLLCPGLGQIYNREHRKGWAIIIVSTAIGLVAAAKLVPQIMARVPLVEGIPMLDPLELPKISAAVMNENRHMLFAVTYSLIGIWAYSITQAYFKGKEISRDDTVPKEDE